jgi:hypothetical protein
MAACRRNWTSLHAGTTAALLAFLGMTVAAIAGGRPDVDMALVLAVDVSFSISIDERDIQRRGYVSAFRTPEIIRAATSGPLGRIAVTYVEWAGPEEQRQILPWTVLDNRAAVFAFADRLEAAPVHRSGRTSLSGALAEAVRLFEDSPVEATRRVIDISSDGVNNSGPPVVSVRDLAAGLSITINGLPLMGAAGSEDSPVPLDSYYRDCVIAGPGAFVFPVNDWSQFAETLKKKLALEIAYVPGFSGMVHLASIEVQTDCLIGEKEEREKYIRQLDEMTGGKSERWQLREQDWPTPR